MTWLRRIEWAVGIIAFFIGLFWFFGEKGQIVLILLLASYLLGHAVGHDKGRAEGQRETIRPLVRHLHSRDMLHWPTNFEATFNTWQIPTDTLHRELENALWDEWDSR